MAPTLTVLQTEWTGNLGGPHPIVIGGRGLITRGMGLVAIGRSHEDVTVELAALEAGADLDTENISLFIVVIVKGSFSSPLRIYIHHCDSNHKNVLFTQSKINIIGTMKTIKKMSTLLIRTYIYIQLLCVR